MPISTVAGRVVSIRGTTGTAHRKQHGYMWSALIFPASTGIRVQIRSDSMKDSTRRKNVGELRAHVCVNGYPKDRDLKHLKNSEIC
jgi:hypothetical protein